MAQKSATDAESPSDVADHLMSESETDSSSNEAQKSTKSEADAQKPDVQTTTSEKSEPSLVVKQNESKPQVKPDKEAKETDEKPEAPVFTFDSLTESIKKKKERTPHLKETKDGVPLVIDGEEVFRIRASLGAYTATVRVKSIENRIKALEKDPNSARLIKRITTQESGYSTNIVAGSHTLFTVTEPDAKAEGYESRQELALDYAYLLRQALETDLRVFKFEALLVGIALSLLTTGLLVLLIKCVNWTFRQIYLLLDRWKGTVIGPLKIQEAELLSAATITDLLSGFTRVIRVLLFVSIISVYLSFVLSYFPTTKPIAQEGIHLLLRPIAGAAWPAVVSYTPNLIFIICILVSTYYVIAFTHFIFREIERETIQLPGFEADWSMPTYKIARFLIIAFALILLFPYLPGAGSPAFQQVSIFLGVLFSLAVNRCFVSHYFWSFSYLYRCFSDRRSSENFRYHR